MSRSTAWQATAPCRDEILSESAAEGWIPRTCFRTGPPGQVGVELEQVLVAAGPSPQPVPAARHRAVVDDLARAGLAAQVTVEPGGQLELSGPPAPDLGTALQVMDDDLGRLRGCTGRHGVRVQGAGLDPWNAPHRLLRTPRYDAMEAYFDRTGRAGRLMMCSTASVQVNVEAGSGPDDPAGLLGRRWEILHAVGPTLVAAFANSPLVEGRPTGWASSRQAVWAALDPARTGEPRVRAGETLPEAYARWALDAPLLLVGRDGPDWSAPSGVTFRDWLRHGTLAVPGRSGPSPADLVQHLTTLFPPVRARGHLEVRYLDTPPGRWWQVPVAVLTTLVDDAAAADAALAATADVRDRWAGAARHALADDDLHRAAVRLLDDAARRLAATPGTRAVGALVGEYLERWTAPRRTPGDDLLAAGSGTVRRVGGDR